MFCIGGDLQTIGSEDGIAVYAIHMQAVGDT